jgi:tripeptide aminopeptidase
VVTLAKKASHNLGIPLKTVTIGGGADANVFFSKGITAGVLGTGMQNLHTTNESIALKDMVQAVELLLEIIKIHSRSCGERVK